MFRIPEIFISRMFRISKIFRIFECSNFSLQLEKIFAISNEKTFSISNGKSFVFGWLNFQITNAFWPIPGTFIKAIMVTGEKISHFKTNWNCILKWQKLSFANVKTFIVSKLLYTANISVVKSTMRRLCHFPSGTTDAVSTTDRSILWIIVQCNVDIVKNE